MQIGQDSMGKLCPILFCNRWGTFNMGAGITFWKLTCSHTWCPGSPHIAGGWKAGAFLEFLSLCALSWPGSFSIVRLLTCWLRAPKVCVPRMSEPRFQGREIDSDGEAQPYTVRRVGASRAWSLSGSTTCHTTFSLWSIFNASSSGSISFLMVFWLLSGLDLCLHVLPIAVRYNSLNLGLKINKCQN